MRKILSLLVIFILINFIVLPLPAYAVCDSNIAMPEQIYSSSPFNIAASLIPGKYGLLIYDTKNKLWIDKGDGHRNKDEVPILVRETDGRPIYFDTLNSGGTLSLGLIPGNSYIFSVVKINSIGPFSFSDHCGGAQTKTAQPGTSPPPKTNTCTANQSTGQVENDDCDPRGPNPYIAKISSQQSGAQISYTCKCGHLIQGPVGPTIKGPCEPGFCETAFGRIDTSPAGFIKSIFTILLGFAGIIAVTLIVISGYRLMASQGNPEKVQEAREQLTSAIVGLLFIIFSLSILTIIGVDILKIPGFDR